MICHYIPRRKVLHSDFRTTGQYLGEVLEFCSLTTNSSLVVKWKTHNSRISVFTEWSGMWWRVLLVGNGLYAVIIQHLALGE